jgi:multiple antibiotic resistance protein
MNWNEYIQIFTTLFAITNPLSEVPLFLSFTENMQDKRPQTARKTSLAVAVILIVTVMAGDAILRFFNISVDAFRVAGGILLLIMAFNMLEARLGRTKRTPEEDREAIDSDSVAVVPLALPLLAGPGAISTVILYSNQMPGIGGKLILSVICMLIALSIWVILRLAPEIGKRMSRTNMNIMTRVMGLILAAMSIEFIVNGLGHLLPGLLAK